MEPSNWIQERSPRSKGNKYREKYCAEQAEAFALNRHQKLYLLGADCVTFDWLSAPEAENTLARKVSFPFIQSLIMWPDFCLLNLSCSHKVRASRIFFFLLFPQKLWREGGAECSSTCCSSSVDPNCCRGTGTAGLGAKLFLSASPLSGLSCRHQYTHGF